MNGPLPRTRMPNLQSVDGFVAPVRSDGPFPGAVSVAEPAAVLGASEETLVSDTRADLTPAEMVELKLVSRLKSGPLPVSQLHRTWTANSRSRH